MDELSKREMNGREIRNALTSGFTQDLPSALVVMHAPVVRDRVRVRVRF